MAKIDPGVDPLSAAASELAGVCTFDRELTLQVLSLALPGTGLDGLRSLPLERYLSQVHPADREAVRQAFAQAAAAGTAMRVGHRLLRAEGDRDPLCLQWRGRWDAAAGHGIAVLEPAPPGTESAEAPGRGALAARLEQILDTIADGIVVYDADGRLVYCNRRFRELYGYSDDEARPGVHFRELGRLDVARGNVVIGTQEDGRAYLDRKAAYRRELRGVFDVQLSDGRWFQTRDRRTPDGGFISVQTDITERKLAEQRLQAAKEEAEAANRAKTEFLAQMSHELRTPLNAIIGFADIIRFRMFGDRSDLYATYAEDIHRSGCHLLELINDVLDMARLDRGSYQLDEDWVAVDDTIDDCLRMIAPQARAAGVAVHSELAPGLPVLRADARAVRQVLLNLLTNAVKFTGTGGHVQVSAELADSGTLRLSVRDNGTGIAEADLERVMHPFEQARSRSASAGAGTGLGLAISRQLMELHGGSLTLDSREGAGTTATMTFPPERMRFPEAG